MASRVRPTVIVHAVGDLPCTRGGICPRTSTIGAPPVPDQPLRIRVVVVQARVYGAVMISRQLAVAFDAHDPARLAQFWAGMLGRKVLEDAGGVLLPGDDTQLGLRFVASSGEQVGPNRRMHLHLTSASQADQQHTVATALGLGASHLDVGQRPEEGTLSWLIPRVTSSA